MLPGPPRHQDTKKIGSSSWLSWCLCVLVVTAGFSASVRAAGAGPDLTVTPIARDGQIVVSFDLSDGYTPDVRDAIHSGLLTTFTYELDLRRGAALFDRTVASVTLTAVVRFDNLTRRYQMWRTVDGRVEDARPTEDQEAVRAWMTHFERVPLSATTALEANGEYYVRVRAQTRPRNSWLFWPWGGTALGQAKFTFIQ
jgi:hypothetical protein